MLRREFSKIVSALPILGIDVAAGSAINTSEANKDMPYKGEVIKDEFLEAVFNIYTPRSKIVKLYNEEYEKFGNGKGISLQIPDTQSEVVIPFLNVSGQCEVHINYYNQKRWHIVNRHCNIVKNSCIDKIRHNALQVIISAGCDRNIITNGFPESDILLVSPEIKEKHQELSNRDVVVLDELGKNYQCEKFWYEISKFNLQDKELCIGITRDKSNFVLPVYKELVRHNPGLWKIDMELGIAVLKSTNIMLGLI